MKLNLITHNYGTLDYLGCGSAETVEYNCQAYSDGRGTFPS